MRPQYTHKASPHWALTKPFPIRKADLIKLFNRQERVRLTSSTLCTLSGELPNTTPFHLPPPRRASLTRLLEPQRSPAARGSSSATRRSLLSATGEGKPILVRDERGGPAPHPSRRGCRGAAHLLVAAPPRSPPGLTEGRSEVRPFSGRGSVTAAPLRLVFVLLRPTGRRRARQQQGAEEGAELSRLGRGRGAGTEEDGLLGADGRSSVAAPGFAPHELAEGEGVGLGGGGLRQLRRRHSSAIPGHAPPPRGAPPIPAARHAPFPPADRAALT